MKLLKRKLPELRSDRVCCRLLEPHEATKMVDFRKDNKDHLEKWEPRRPSEFFTEGFWQIHLRLALKDFRDGTSACFSMLSVDEEQVIGVCNYTNIVRGTFQSCHLGYALSHRFEGAGVMYEALSLTNAYMFKDLGLHRIMAGYLPHNDRSGKLLERLGFEKEGLARKYLKINGRWEDHVLTSLVNDDY
ncbi:MAG: ribosomal protein S5-alanine N-acetyltransferase [Pseudomonadales bacterium]|nr:ribosomal protein S5-alanine N-acetyltransferase [Pseudomonadales bacterium]MBO6701824.1 ribosomal protein S5-alanine N-acetyltransferase [Pseudomonadales bacterium]MBO7005485.1 ribosomal protein S5-alanine N-acetyltransferase [Pseudomonadales bacterium]